MHLPAGGSAPNRDQSSFAKIAKYKNSRSANPVRALLAAWNSLPPIGDNRLRGVRLARSRIQNPPAQSVLITRSLPMPSSVKGPKDDGKDKDDDDKDENNDGYSSEHRASPTRFLIAGRSESRQPQTLERGASRSSTDARHNDQFKNGDTREVHPIVLDLAHCFRGTEIPLLSHNFTKRESAIRRPPQDKLLGTLCLAFFEDERDAYEPLRLVEDEPDGLSSRTTGTPAPHFS